jgi:hypothetical protein
MDYQSPELKTYGSVTDLTAAIGPSAKEDFDVRAQDENTRGSFNVTN